MPNVQKSCTTPCEITMSASDQVIKQTLLCALKHQWVLQAEEARFAFSSHLW